MMQNSNSDLLINSKYVRVSIDIYFRIDAQPGTNAPPNYIGRHIVLDGKAESIKIDELENIRKDIARTYGVSIKQVTPVEPSEVELLMAPTDGTIN